MKEDNKNRNIWAEKLNQLPLPEAAPMWKDMKSRLDRAMPEKKNHRKRWIVILPILIIGIAAVLIIQPGHNDQNNAVHGNGERGSSVNIENQKTIHQDDRSAKGSHAPGSSRQPHQQDSAGSLLSSHPGRLNDTKGSWPALQQNKLKRENVPVERFGTRKEDEQVAKRTVVTGTVAKNKGNVPKEEYNKYISGSSESAPPASLKKNSSPDIQSLKPVIVSFSNLLRDTMAGQGVRDISKLLKLFGSPDSASQMPGARDKQKPKTAYALAIGVNQIFALGEQDKTRFNSKGESGTWSDYLPVPQFRIHHGKRLHAQLEVQFNTPQYTKQLPIDRVIGDTNLLGQRQQKTIFIKKLFYFNAPLSVHYRIGEHVTVGAGIQYARLTNAVAFQEQKNFTGSRPDSNTTGKIIRLKGDTVYQRLRTNEIRFLLDASYRWRNFHAGIRYNQAITPFVNYRISNTEIAQARNNSLQAYIRYTLFEW